MKEKVRQKTKEYKRVEHPLHIDKDLNFQLNPLDDIKDSFFIVKNLESGKCGTVCQVVHLPSMRVFAGKRISLKKLNHYQENELENQISQLKSIISTYTVRVYGAFKKDEEIIILSEYCDRGSLRDYLDFKKAPLSEDTIAVIMRDVIRGLILLHTKYNLIHCGIRASNVMISSNGFVKLADIAIDPIFYQSQSLNPFWCSPEYLESSTFDSSTDIWSIGATAVELSEGSPPYIEFPLTNAISKIVKFGFPGFRDENHSPEFIDFVKKCMKKEPSKRPKLSELMEHEFIKKAERLPRKAVLYGLLSTSIKKILTPTKLYENEEIIPRDSPFSRSISSSHLFNPPPFPRQAMRFTTLAPKRTSLNSIKICSDMEARWINDDLPSTADVSKKEDVPKYFTLEEDFVEQECNAVAPPSPLENTEISEYINKCKEMASKVNFVPLELSRFPPSDFSAVYSLMDENGDIEPDSIIKNSRLDLIAILQHKDAPKNLAWIYVVIAVYLGGLKGLTFLGVISLLVLIASSLIFPKFFHDKQK